MFKKKTIVSYESITILETNIQDESKIDKNTQEHVVKPRTIIEQTMGKMTERRTN